MTPEEIKDRIKQLDKELLENQYHCLEAFTYLRDGEYSGDIASIQQFHGVIGAKNNFADCKNGKFLTFESFWQAWLKGLYEHTQQCLKRGSKPLIVKVIEDNFLREYVKIFLERNYYRNYKARIRTKPLETLTEIWFGKNGESLYGLYIAPNSFEGNWYNKDRDIRNAKFDYWTVGHVLSTGLVTDNTEDGIVKFDNLDKLIQFYNIIFRRASSSEYEKIIIDKYLSYLKNSNNPEKIPFLIPEFRYLGKEKEHEYRLDFTILNIYRQRYVGFEISPSSSHMSLSKIKNRTKKEINNELSGKWEKEMHKRNAYFMKYNISLVTFTDSDLTDIDECFQKLQKELVVENEDIKTAEDYLELIKSL